MNWIVCNELESMKYQALIFDWDGTLMDSVAKIVACTQAAARDLGLVVPEYDEAKQIIGLGLNEAMARLFDIYDENEVQLVAAQYRHHFLGDEPTEEILFDGIEELLKSFESEGYLLAVATGKSDAQELRSYEPKSLFENFINADSFFEVIFGENPS